MAIDAFERHNIFVRLLDELPMIGASDDVDHQTRAVLSPLVELIVRTDSHAEAIPVPPAVCPNCGLPTDSDRSPYYSPFCRDQAAFIRQFRASVADGVIFDPERQIGMGQALWSLRGGGYPRRQSLVPPKVLAKVIKRDGGVCAICGAPATEIDHTGSG